MKKVNLIKVNKKLNSVLFFVLLFTQLIMSQNTTSESHKTIYVIIFGDYFRDDVIDFYFNNYIVLNKVKLKSSESAGATGISVSIFRENDNYFSLSSPNNEQKTMDVKADYNSIKVIYKGKIFKYQIHNDKGIYIVVEKNKENVIFTQYKKRPVFD